MTLDDLRAMAPFEKMALLFLIYLSFVGYMLLAKVIEILNYLKKGEDKL